MVSDLFWHRLLRRPYRLQKTVDKGQGQTVIVLIHGLGSQARHWSALIDILEPDKYRIIAYDLLGFGTSPKPAWNNYSVDQHVQSILYSLSKDIGKQQFVLIGHSMGCIISAHLSHVSNHQVAKLVLYQPPLLLDSEARRSLRRRVYQYYGRRPALLLTLNRLIGRFTNKLSHLNLDKQTWTPFERSLNNTIIAQNTINELATLQINTDIIYGRLDFVVSRKDAKKLAAINPKIKLHHVTEMHDITSKSSRYLKKLLEN